MNKVLLTITLLISTAGLLDGFHGGGGRHGGRHGGGHGGHYGHGGHGYWRGGRWGPGFGLGLGLALTAPAWWGPRWYSGVYYNDYCNYCYATGNCAPGYGC